MRVAMPRSVRARSNSAAAHRAAIEEATASAGSITMPTSRAPTIAIGVPVAATAAAPAAVRRNCRRLKFLFIKMCLFHVRLLWAVSSCAGIQWNLHSNPRT